MIDLGVNFSTMTEMDFTSTNTKKKVLMLSIWYPLSISRYFERAFRRRDDVELYAVGPYTGQWIPWQGGQTLPSKYAIEPEFPIGQPGMNIPYSMVKSKLGFEPDLVITVDAGIHWTSRPDVNCPVVHVATDPHVLDYNFQRGISDYFFNMQKCYSRDGDIYLPYAFDPKTHWPLDGSRFGGFGKSVDGLLYFAPSKVDKDYDVSLIGMPYPNRVALVDRLRSEGLFVIFENGPIFDEYRELANRSEIGLNWSSLDDMVARVFEIMGMGLVPVINRVPDLKEFFVEDEHYLGFSTLEEAVEKVKWAKRNPVEAKKIADNACKLVWETPHTYDARVQQIMETVGLV